MSGIEHWVPCICPRCKKQYDAMVREPHGLARLGRRFRLVCWDCTCLVAGPGMRASMKQARNNGADAERGPKCDDLPRKKDW